MASESASNLNDLNVRLCEAFNVDPNENAGFRLTVLGVEVPALEVFKLPPMDGNGLADDQVKAVESISERFVILDASDPRAEQV